MNGKPLITIVIPTYNRPYYLRRILKYYSEYGENYSVIVADSSSEGNKNLNKDIISSFSILNILHLSYPPKLNLFHKIAYAANHVDTMYCTLCADDDFITSNGINQSIDFLEKNSDFTIAHGYYISFYLKTDKNGKQHFYWASIYPYTSNIFMDSEFRLAEHLSNYSVPTLYAVHRAGFLKMIFKETLKFTDDGQFGELLPSILTLIYGKMKRLEVLYAAREKMPSSLGATCEDLKDFVKAGTYDEKYAKFRDCLAMHTTKNSQLNIEASKKVIDDSMKLYIDVFTRRHNVLIRKMKEHLDYEIIRELYRKMFRRNDYTAWSNSAPSTEHLEDFNKIKKLVISGR